MRCYKLLLFDCCRQVGDMRGRSTSVPAKYYHSHIIPLFLSLLMSTSCQQDCRAGFHSSRSTECPAHRGSLQRLHLDHLIYLETRMAKFFWSLWLLPVMAIFFDHMPYWPFFWPYGPVGRICHYLPVYHIYVLFLPEHFVGGCPTPNTV